MRNVIIGLILVTLIMGIALYIMNKKSANEAQIPASAGVSSGDKN